MNNTINLKFNENLHALAGFEYGQDVFKNQVEGVIDINRPLTIVFPDHIKQVACSFSQGLLGEFIAKHSTPINIKSVSAKLTKKIWHDLRR